MFGAASYFTNSSGKADQYTSNAENPPDQDKFCYMFLARVVMGDALITYRPLNDNGIVLRDPNEDRWLKERGTKVDSVFAPTGTEDCAVWRFSEWMVYDTNQAYPQYLIEYERVISPSRFLFLHNFFLKIFLIKNSKNQPKQKCS